MAFKVRASKFRHVFANEPNKGFWDGVRLTKNAWDSNWATASSKWVCMAWDTAGGGAVGVLDAKKPGKLEPTQVPLISGHKGAVLDLEFDPFSDSLLATCSEDCTAKIWQIPDEGFKGHITESVQTLKGHKRKVGCVKYNPVVRNVLATAAQDYEVVVWDVETGASKYKAEGHTAIIQSLDWNYNGSLIVSNAKDKMARVVDPRQQKIALSVESHVGVKGGRAIWLGKHDMFLTVGFGKNAMREFKIFDFKAGKEITTQNLDNSAGIVMPFYDEDSDLLFLAGKGDGAIRYYEVVPGAEGNSIIEPISAFKSNDPTAAACSLPRRSCDVSVNEIIRLYKVTKQKIVPLQFQVPRKSDLFQDDLFPPCRSDEPALEKDAWFAGENATPKTKSLEGGFVAAANSGPSFKKIDDSEKELSPVELKKENETLFKRVAYLEAEIAKKDAHIADLEAKLAAK
jgi:coronin-1B/1C/6